jgi:NitT/TauT family transport system substrate-binding protein
MARAAAVSAMNRRAVLQLGVAAAAVSPFAAFSQAPATIRAGASLDDGITPLLYAMHAGIFTKHGLDVTLQGSSSGAALASAVAGGVVDIAKSSLMSLIAAYTHGIHFKIVAGAALYTGHEPTDELVALKTTGITALTQVNGKTIICSAVLSLDQLGVMALIDKRGGNSSTVKFIELPFPAMFGALEQGRADMASIGNPILAANLATGKLRTFGDAYEGLGAPLLVAGWFCSQDYLLRNRPVVERFGAAMREATIYTNGHHAETVPLLADYAHLDPSVIRQMNRLTNATVVQARDIQPAIDAAAKYKFITAGFPASELLP